MSPVLRLPALVFLSTTAAFSLSCSSSQKTATSGGAHFEIVSDGAVTDPALKCDDIGVQKDIATVDGGTKKLIVDGADGAVVSCQFDSSHFTVQVVNPNGDSVSASGTISGSKSSDANITIGFLGSSYQNPAATKCTVTFVCTDSGGCGTDPLPKGSSMEGHFTCAEIDNSRTAKECSITGANPAGLSNSYFKFNDCTGF
jgi:hypothetical protein